jgi:uncharacterized protein (DUF2236 family)
VNNVQRHRDAVRDRLLRSDHERAGPGSVTWSVNREVIVVAGWGRAILMQLAHPSVAAGVHHHSSFRGSLRASLKRLQSTVGAMQAITFGDTDAMIEAAARVNAIHDRVRGHCDAGASYSAHDPELQRWVHATLLESIPLAYERLVGPLSTRERDQYCVESAIMEPLLGMPVNSLPRSATQLDTYMREMLSSDQLQVTDTSRALARAVLYPPNWRVAWPAFRAMQLLTIGSLPPSVRDAYGFDWTSRDERALVRWTATIRNILRLMPSVAREWPISRLHHKEIKGDV